MNFVRDEKLESVIVWPIAFASKAFPGLKPGTTT